MNGQALKHRLKLLFRRKARSFLPKSALIFGLRTLAPTLILAVGLAVFFWPVGPEKQPSAEFLDNGVLQIKNTESFKSVKLYEAPNRLVAEVRILGRPLIQLPFPWKPRTSHKILIDDQPPLLVMSPERSPELVVRLSVPLGQKPFRFFFGANPSLEKPAEISLPVSAGERIDLMLEAEKLTDKGELNFEIYAGFGDEKNKSAANRLKLKSPLAEDKSGAKARLSFEFDKKIWTAEIKIGSSLPKQPLNIVLKGRKVNIPLRINFVSEKLDPRDIIISEWKMPVDKSGERSARHAADQVAIPGQIWSLAAHWLNITPMLVNYFEPFAFQSLKIKNNSRRPVNLALESVVTDGNGSGPLKYFKTPDFRLTGARSAIVGLVKIPAGETRKTLVPFYLRPQTPAGSYMREIKIISLGSNRVLRVVKKPLTVIRSNSRHALWTLAASASAFFWIALSAVFYRRAAKSFGARALTLLALLGSLQFCLSLIGGVVSNLFFALLGPFNCLAGGLFSEILNYLVVSAILFIMPRAGAMTVTGLITYLMGGIMFGSFGLVDFIYMGSSIFFREFFLFVAGVTKIHPDYQRVPSVWLMAAALGTADALSKYTSLALQTVFYRLFFADWYVVLQVVAAGFLYTALGVFLGRFSGGNLARTRL